MHVEAWNPNRMDATFENVAVERLVKAARIVRAAARRKCPVGTISRPMYRTGPYAGQTWTARDAGRLRKSIRVVRKKTPTGRAFSKKKGVRIYCGHFTAYYAAIVEHSRPFMRPALEEAMPMVKSIIGAK